VTNECVNRILTKVIYAGYLESPEWGRVPAQGKHEGLVSFDSFERIQQRLTEGAQAPARSDLNADFPLRGAVACAACGKPLTARWSISKTGANHAYYYYYYYYVAKGCARKGKSI
jgi:hypothetical protein